MGRPSNYAYHYVRVIIEANGSVTMNSYSDSTCSDESLADVQSIAADVIETNLCGNTTYNISSDSKFSINQGGGDSSSCRSVDTGSSSSSTPSPSTTQGTGLSIGAIAGIATGVISLLVVIVLLIVARKRRHGSKDVGDSDRPGYDAYLGVQKPRSQLAQSGTAPSDGTGSLQNTPPRQAYL